jgi:DNA-binding GntR family transcriptional regulator
MLFVSAGAVDRRRADPGTMTASPSRTDTAYQALRQAIIEQALPPGTRLPEDEIGRHFGMSRTLARETLGRLQREGLIEAGRKRTAMVARPSLDEAKDEFELRRVLEREAVRLVLARWQPEYGAILEGHVREEERAKSGHDPRISIRLAGEFHIKLAAMAGNRRLERYLSEVVSRCSLILALHGRPHSPECAVAEHGEIIAALRRGDAAAAIDLMDRHLGAVEQRALINEQHGTADLGAVLSRYAGRVTSASGGTPLASRRRARAQ